MTTTVDATIDILIKSYHDNTLDKECILLGNGASGKVYGLNEYAIKIYAPRYENCIYSDKFKDPFILEKLNHPCFPKVYHYERGKFMIFDRIKGVSFHNIKSNPTAKLAQNWKDILMDAWYHCVSKNITPFDVDEPTNIIINEEGIPIIIDVGLFDANRTYSQQESRKMFEGYISDLSSYVE